MRVLSFDVGIKNLSACIIHKKDDINFDIDYWNIINLTVEENQEVITCTALNKSKKSCTSKAKFLYEKNGLSDNTRQNFLLFGLVSSY